MAFRYSGSAQVGDSTTAAAPKAAALRKMDPTLSGFDTPSSTTSGRAGRAVGQSSSSSLAGRTPSARQPRWNRNPVTCRSRAESVTWTSRPAGPARQVVSAGSRSASTPAVSSSARVRNREASRRSTAQPALGDEQAALAHQHRVGDDAEVVDAAIVDRVDRDAVDPHGSRRGLVKPGARRSAGCGGHRAPRGRAAC